MLTASIVLGLSILGIGTLVGFKVFNLRAGNFYAFGPATKTCDDFLLRRAREFVAFLATIHVRLALAQALKWVATHALILVHRVYQTAADVHEKTRNRKLQKNKHAASFFFKSVLEHKHEYGRPGEKE